MGSPVISVRGLGKKYRLGETIRHDTLRDKIAHSLKTLFARKVNNESRIANRESHPNLPSSPRSALRAPELPPVPPSALRPPPSADFWALKDVSFDVQQGEVLGIIGRNGAGKSTLLKILSQITEPTEGEIHMRGRVASLLEVGTGFHPELTGRENIFLNGAILGMARAEIGRKFDEIVAFSEIEKFIDTPVKRYSSGMYVRLAFAVAAHLDPEILIVDEVLAVGDAAFQKKCLGKMSNVAKGGRTILFVSHNMQAVSSLCTKAVLLDKGQVVEMGNTAAVTDSYLKRSATSSYLVLSRAWDSPEEAPGNATVRLGRVRVLTGIAAEAISMATSFEIEIEYWHLQPEQRLFIDLVFYTEDGSAAFESYSAEVQDEPATRRRAGLFRSVCHIPGDLLNEGTYRIRVQFVDDSSAPILNLNDALTIDIHDSQPRHIAWYGRCYGSVHPKLKWNSEFLHPNPESATEHAASEAASRCHSR